MAKNATFIPENIEEKLKTLHIKNLPLLFSFPIELYENRSEEIM